MLEYFIKITQFHIETSQRGCVNTCGGKRSKVHSMQAVTPGSTTLTLPLNPSVPPSTRGTILPCNTLHGEIRHLEGKKIDILIEKIRHFDRKN